MKKTTRRLLVPFGGVALLCALFTWFATSDIPVRSWEDAGLALGDDRHHGMPSYPEY
jgi:hypothetical protein